MQRGKTGDGYVYYRTRARGHDVTVYEHQLMALQHFEAGDVFDPDQDVHHLPPAPDANAPNGVLHLRWLDVVDRVDHRSNGGDRHGVEERRRD